MINVIKNVKQRAIIGNLNNIDELVDRIKNPSKNYKKIVDKARSLDRKSDEYRKIKTNELEAVSINFNFNNYIKGDNLNEATGYLYIDVDNSIPGDEILSSNLIHAYWRSLSNNGMTIICRVNSLNKENFKEATIMLGKLLELEIDTQAISIDRLTIIPYDYNAYFNPNSTILNCDKTITNKDKVNSNNFRNANIINKQLIGSNHNGKNIRYNNFEELKKQMKIEYNSDGLYDIGKGNNIQYLEAFIPRKVKIGRRESCLSTYAKTLLFLNPNIDKDDLHKIIFHANNNKLVEPLSHKEVMSIINKSLRYNGNIRNNKSKRFLYEDDKIGQAEKSRLCNKIITSERRKETLRKKEKIKHVLDNWRCEDYGKVTAKKIMQLTILKKTMIYDYLKENRENLPNCDN